MSSFLEEIFNLSGKVAAVIGGGGHLCSEMARGLARAGCTVVVLDINLDKASAVEKELKIFGAAQTLSLEIDVTKKEQHDQTEKYYLLHQSVWLVLGTM